MNSTAQSCPPPPQTLNLHKHHFARAPGPKLRVSVRVVCLGGCASWTTTTRRDAVGQPVMRQVACFGSLPPRWLTKNFSACCVITARRASHASPGQKERPRAAAARLAAPRRAAPRLALQQRTRTRTHAPALAPRERSNPPSEFRTGSQKVPARTANRFDHRRWRFLQRHQRQ